MSDFIPSTDIAHTHIGQAHYVSRIDETGLGAVGTVADDSAPSSLWGEVRKNLRGRPIFQIAFTIIIIALAVSAFPSLFTGQDPRFYELSNSLKDPSDGHPFGFNRQGCDIYSRIIYGVRTSVSVGVFTAILVVLFGGAIGATAGYLGDWFDVLLSRITDIFFVIPLLLAAIVLMQMLKDSRNIWVVIIVLSFFGRTQITGITRGAVMSVKNEEFVTAARAAGASKSRILLSHIIPNSMVSIIVYAIVTLGTFIASEAPLSFMGIGLPPEVVPWGADISAAQTPLRTNPMAPFYPALVLALTVLSFIIMDDAVRDALDPKARK